MGVGWADSVPSSRDRLKDIESLEIAQTADGVEGIGTWR